MSESRPPYLHAAGAAGAALLVYVVTLAPTTWFWDTSEYIATAHILGIPHPPGNPLFVVLGRVWSLLLEPTGLPVAVRINLLAAVTSALATGFFFLVAHRVLTGWMVREGEVGTGGADARPRAARRRERRRRGREAAGAGAGGNPHGNPSSDGSGSSGGPAAEGLSAWDRSLPLVGAWAGALLAATVLTVWNQSNVNEKVYTLSVLGIAIVSWLAVLWRDRKDEPGSGWLLVLALYVMVLGSTNHLMALLPAPAFLLLILVEKPAVLLDRRVLARGVAAVILGLAMNFFLPVRSAQQPIINEGEPICESVTGAVAAVYSLGRGGCDALAANLTREQYGKPSLFTDPTSRDAGNPEPRSAGLVAHQLLNYFQYFDWQWARSLSPDPTPGNARLPVTLLFLGLGLWGLVVARRSHRSHLLYLGTLAATLTVGLVFYLNFRYGFSLAPDHIDRTLREVRERDYFFIASFHLWGVLAGIGLAAAWKWASGGGSDGRSRALSAPILLIAFVPLVLNWSWADRTGDHSARDWAYNLLQSVEPYGVLFTNGDNDTFPLWYLQEVEGIRRDVSVIVVQYLYTQWYPRQLRHHTEPERQRPFEDREGLGIHDPPAGAPSRPVTRLSDAELDGIGHAALAEDADVDLGDVVLRYPAGFEMGRGERIALQIIRDSMDERPIHFASTGGLAQTLRLSDRVVRRGLASQLHVGGDLEEAPGIHRTAPQIGGEWVDFERTLRLVRQVFTYRGLQDREVWGDGATLNIPWHFYFLYLQLADAAMQDERDDRFVEELLETAERFLITAEGGSRALR